MTNLPSFSKVFLASADVVKGFSLLSKRFCDHPFLVVLHGLQTFQLILRMFPTVDLVIIYVIFFVIL